MTPQQFRVHGIPAPQGSKRHVGRGILVESSKRVGPWREAVKAAALAAGVESIHGPTVAIIRFYLPRPKSHYRANGQLKLTAPTFCDKRPDVDKLLRSTFDALTDLGLIDDDARIVDLTTTKRYHSHPGALVTYWGADT